MSQDKKAKFEARVAAALRKPAHLRSLEETQLIARSRKMPRRGSGTPFVSDGFKGPSDNLEFESYDKTDEYNAGVPADPADLPNSDGTTAVDPAAGNFADELYPPLTPGVGPHIDLGGFTETDPSLDDPLTSATHARLSGQDQDDEENATPVRLVRGANIENWPDHLSVPKGSRPLFRQGLAFALMNTEEEVIELSATDTQPIVILGYRLMVSNMGFLPIVPGKVLPPYSFSFLMDGSPTLPNQGFEQNTNNFISPFMPTLARNTVALNVAPGGYDMLVATPLIYVQLVIPSGKTLSVNAVNGGAFDRHFGVELYGYIANGSHDLTKFSTVG